MKLFTKGTANPKTAKNSKCLNGAFETLILHLAPYKLSGFNVCKDASKGCVASCLHTAGNPVYMANKERARIARTKFFFEDRDGFKLQIRKELHALLRKCQRENKRPAVRLNGTSDLPWEVIDRSLFSEFSTISFYDYTKTVSRAIGPMPDNYHLTFSKSENNWSRCLQVLKSGGNVAAVFTPEMMSLERFEGWKCWDGDSHDLRFLDPTNVIVKLKAKGKARSDKSGFVVGYDYELRG